MLRDDSSHHVTKAGSAEGEIVELAFRRLSSVSDSVLMRSARLNGSFFARLEQEIPRLVVS
jgi:hypothetical protein